jgi:hypothetical protein
MALDFLNSLKIEEQPLMSLSEIESNNNIKDSDDDNSNDTSTITNEDNSGLTPITDLNNDSDNSSNSNSSSTNSLSKTDKKYAAIIKALHEKTGAFENFNEEEFEDTPESFLEIIDQYTYKNAEAIANNYITSNLTPLQQKFVDLVENGLSQESATEIVQGYKLSENITEDALIEDSSKAKKLYAEYLKYTTAFSEERINKEISKKEDAGTLIDDSLEILEEFKDILFEQEKAAKAEVAKQEYQNREFTKRQTEELQNYLTSTEEIGGIKLSKKLKDNWIKEYSIVETSKGSKVNPILATREVDPNKFDALLRLYHTMGLFKYDSKKKDFSPDFSFIKNIGQNEALNKLQKAVESDTIKRKTGGYSSVDSMDMDVEKEEHKKRWAELAKKLPI